MTRARRRSTACLCATRICTKIRGTSSRCGAWVRIAAPSEEQAQTLPTNLHEGPHTVTTMSNILTRRQTHFVLWCPAVTAREPELIIGQLQNGNPPTFNKLARKVLHRAP